MISYKGHTRDHVYSLLCIYRAPVLVAIALIEFGMEPLDAVEYVRRKRRGAFNKPQISYLVRPCIQYTCIYPYIHS